MHGHGELVQVRHELVAEAYGTVVNSKTGLSAKRLHGTTRARSPSLRASTHHGDPTGRALASTGSGTAAAARARLQTAESRALAHAMNDTRQVMSLTKNTLKESGRLSPIGLPGLRLADRLSLRPKLGLRL